MFNSVGMLQSNIPLSAASLSQNTSDENEYYVKNESEYDCFLNSSLGTDNTENLPKRASEENSEFDGQGTIGTLSMVLLA